MKRLRRGPLLLLAFLALLFVIYALNWNAKSRLMVTSFETEKVLAHNQGKLLKGKAAVNGFPFFFTLTITDFVYDSPGTIRTAAPEVRIAKAFWSPFSSTITASNAYLYLIRHELRTGITSLKAALTRAPFGGKSRKEIALHVSADIEGILAGKNFAALSENIQKLSFNANVSGPLGAEFSQKSIEDWRAAGGTVDIHDFTCLWGSLNLEGEGTAALDVRQQPMASFTVRASGYEPVFSTLVANNQMKPIEATLAKAALKLLEDTPRKGEPPKTRVPLTIQDDTLTAAGLRLARWRPLVW